MSEPRQGPPLRISKDSYMILVNVWMAVALLSADSGHWFGALAGCVLAVWNFVGLLRDSWKFPDLP